MKKIPTWFFAAGAVCGLSGMIWGIQMSATHDHTMSVAHGHLNLVGFVAMSVFGTFYALTPRAAQTRMAVAHLVTSVLSVALLIPGIALALLERGATLAQAGSVLAVLSMALFVYNILRNGVGQGAVSDGHALGGHPAE
ncbi:MAG: hypothetical protein ACU0DK_09755 [Pseudooceanicola sp.]